MFVVFFTHYTLPNLCWYFWRPEISGTCTVESVLPSPRTTMVLELSIYTRYTFMVPVVYTFNLCYNISWVWNQRKYPYWSTVYPHRISINFDSFTLKIYTNVKNVFLGSILELFSAYLIDSFRSRPSDSLSSHFTPRYDTSLVHMTIQQFFSFTSSLHSISCIAPLQISHRPTPNTPSPHSNTA